MRANRKLWAAATVCVTVVVGVTGCSKGEDKPADPFAGLTADAITDKAIQTTKTATAFRINGTGKTDGEKTAVDFSVNDKGVCKGTMSGGEDGKGGKAELLRVDGATYMKGDDAFWRSTGGDEGAPAEEASAMSTLLKGRWMKVPSAAGDKDLDAFCDLKGAVKEIEDEKADRTGLTRGADADVDGAPAAALTKKGTKGETITFYVATDAAKPYLLRVVKTGGEDPGTLTFSEYDKPVAVTAPPADQVMDMAELAGAGS